MENKYYTPIASEFYTGFEYEWCEPEYDGNDVFNRHWVKEVFDFDNTDFFKFNDIYEKRVKCLDKIDIESLGYVLNTNSNIFHKDNISITGGGIINDTYRFIIIREHDVIFEGTIKNKSELVKLLIQLGIDEKV